DGTVLVCLNKTDDQARNILRATEIALPLVAFTHLRPGLEPRVSKSIDLVTLRSLGNRLGRHGGFAYQKYFYEPAVLQEPSIRDLYEQLVEIDNRGYFAPILLNELTHIGEGYYASG